MGHVNDIFTADRLAQLRGYAAIGHVRYSTAGDSSLKNAQPIAVDYSGGSVAVGHNGNLVNAAELRERLEADGAIFQTTSDTEVIVHLIARSREQTLPERMADALRQVRGAYSLVFLSEDRLIAVRDPMGFRPLALGKLARTPGSCSSETCAFELHRGRVRARHRAGRDGRSSTATACAALRPFGRAGRAPLRLRVGLLRAPGLDDRRHARSTARASAWGGGWPSSTRSPADVVIPVPDSGVAAAIGYARESGIPYDQGLMRSHYVGRTFIEPSQHIRHFGVKLKLSPVREVLRGQARGGGRRLDRARHDLAQDRRDDPRRRRARGAHAHQLAADGRPLPLRHRHADAPRS